MKTKFYYFAFVLLLATACRKEPRQLEETTSPKAAETLQLKKVKINPTLGNEQNPFDYTGAIHNEGLQELFDYTVATGDTTRAGKAKFLQSFFQRRFGAQVDGIVDQKLETRILKNYKDVHRLIKMSDQAHAYLSQMNESIDGIKSLNSYDQFRKDIIGIENTIISSSLADLEKNSLLVTASIMRHSAYFWMNFANNNEKMETMGLLRKIAGVITGIAADGTSALYYMFRRADIFEVLDDAIGMSEICGFYTGGFSYW